MGKNIFITESQLKHILENKDSVNESNIPVEDAIEDGKHEDTSSENMVSEARTKVDNFDAIAKLINLTDPDKFFFVQIMKRWKDNKDKGMIKKTDGTYHGGAEYGNFANNTAFKVHNAQELMQLKPQIMKYCDANNTRAYITCNPRSETEINNFLPTYLSKQAHRNHGIVPSYDKKYGFEHLAGQPKHGTQWNRPRFFLDIDSTDKRIWGMTKTILKSHNVPIETEYTTPSGGLHVVIADSYGIANLDKLISDLRVFDGFKDMGKNQTVHANFDGKLILYSNVDTAGY